MVADTSNATQGRPRFDGRAVVEVKSSQDLMDRFGRDLFDGFLFVRDDQPPAAGGMVLVEFVLSNGAVACRVAGRVQHSRPAMVPGEATAGMGLDLVQFDAVARKVVKAVLAQPGYEAVSPPAREGDHRKAAGLRIMAAANSPLLNMSGPVVGIDLGTSNSCVAAMIDGEATVIADDRGYETVPSVVYFEGEEEVIGRKAVERMVLNPQNAVYGSKRFLGRPFRSKEVLTVGHFFNYELAAGPDGFTAARVGGAVVPLVEISARILTRLREMSSQRLGCEVSRAVITVPAYFGETQRVAVREAGRLAGLHVERLLSEPTAAAVGYGYGRGLSRTVLVYDLGGGTFDVSLLRIEGNVLEVLATEGDPFLGGADFDDRLTEYALMHCERTHGINVREDPIAVQRIRFAVELAKRQLSEAEQAQVELPYLGEREGRSVDLNMMLQRSLFESLTQDLVDRTMGIVDSVLSTAGLHAAQLDDVLLVGGQTRSPHVRQSLVQRFGRKPSSTVHPDQSVATGAAMVGDIMHGNRPAPFTDLLPASIRLGRSSGASVVLLPKRTRLPATKRVEVQGKALHDELLLCRGEEQLTADNTPLGVLALPDDQREGMQRGKIEVVVHVSQDGLLSVTSRDPATGETRAIAVPLQN